MKNSAHFLRNGSFGLTALLVIILICATVLEKQYGTSFTSSHIYGSPLFVSVWAITTLCSFCYLLRRKLYRRKATFLLHIALILILTGALLTYLTGLQGNIHLRQGEAPTQQYQDRNGNKRQLPFKVSLQDFHLDYYPGTFAPMDFISSLKIENEGYTVEGKVSMNHIYSYHHYRFYQSTYDADGKGSTLSVSYDPYGIAVSYSGYALLILSFLFFFIEPHSRFRQLLHHPSLQKTTLLLLALISTYTVQANRPHTLPRTTAQAFGNLYVYYNERICPLQTMAKDFTTKLYGKPTYKGLTPEQVLTGWFFYYDEWKQEPMILIKNQEVKQILGISGKYARLADFTTPTGYKLEKLRQDTRHIQSERAIEEANEKFSLVSMLCTGNLLKLYPYRDMETSQLTWYSITDDLPLSIPQEQWTFIRYSMNYIAEKVAHHQFGEAEYLITQTRKYQQKEAAGFLPSDARIQAEKVYNHINLTCLLSVLCMTVGFLSFVYYCRQIIRNRPPQPVVDYLLLILSGIAALYLALLISIRGFVSGHLPLSNGYETMQFMGACAILLTFCFYRKTRIAISFGFLLCGLSLSVAMIGEANPPITPLMPVLSSPLLSIHVMTIMIAYSLLAFTALNGVTALILSTNHNNQGEVIRLQVISQLILYPAIFFLATGIFFGAVWANVAWGRYWGWDPKEVWALITLLIYAFALHADSLPAFRQPLFFHRFTIIAFLSVLITYFGVNFLMGGLHSYA